MLTFAQAHPTVWKPALVFVDAEQTPNHQRLAVRIKNGQKRMNASEGIPDAIVGVVVRFSIIPERVLTSVVLR